MRRGADAAVALVALVALSSGPAVAAEPPIRVSVSAPWALVGVPVPAVVTVHSAQARELALSLTCGDSSARALMSVRGGKSSQKTVLLPAPGPQSYACSPRVRWTADDGQSGSEGGSIASNDVDVVLATPHAEVELMEEWRTGDVSARQLPDRWQGYPQKMTLVLQEQADRLLEDGQRRAIATWTIAGGRLVLVGSDAFVAGWKARGAVLARTVDDAQQALDWALGEDNPQDDDDATSYRVPGTEVVPVGGFLLLALIFGLLVGPVNLWWVIKKKRKRHLFLITTPLLSLAACALLIGYNLISEGLHVRRAAVQLTWLDGEHHRAITWNGVSYFAGLGVDELEVDAEALVLQRQARRSEALYYDDFDEGPSPRLGADWTGPGQRLTGGWIPSRLNTQLVFTTPTAERRRLTVTRDGDGYQLENGLDVALYSIEWRDPDGVRWSRSEMLEPGTRSPLERGSASAMDPELGRLGTGARRAWARTAAPGHFTAELRVPLTPVPGPEATDEERPRAWVIGPLLATASATTAQATEAP